MMTGTGEWWARLTATEPTMRCMALNELPTSMTGSVSQINNPRKVPDLANT